MKSNKKLIETAFNLARGVEELNFSLPVHTVYNPLQYAWIAHRAYLEKWGSPPKEVVLVGMNPGPWGMVQTGVPFGEVNMVRDWLGIEGKIKQPKTIHPGRPITGFSCTRSEVSGARLWGWARERFGTPDRFFRRFFVYNYCPLAFLEESGRNRTPDKLRAPERKVLFELCDQALRETITILSPSLVVGVGRFAHERSQSALDGFPVRVGLILHPSPASPKANRGWREAAERDLEKYGIILQAESP